MEVNSRDGGCGQTGSSSSSGTTSSGTDSLPSSNSIPAAGIHVGLGLHDDDDNVSQEEVEEKMKHIRSLVQEFFTTPPSANYSIIGGDMDMDMGAHVVVDRWLMELGVDRVLHLPSGRSSWQPDHTSESDADIWIWAVGEIVDTIGFMESLFPDRGPVDMPSIFKEQDQVQHEADSSVVPDDQFQFARFIQETMFKMLSFVDAIVATAMDPNPNGVPALYKTLNVLLRVRGALSDALFEMEDMSLLLASSPAVARIADAMAGLLRAKDVKAREAIWSTMEGIRARIVSKGIQTPHRTSSDIHKLTRSVMGHINFMLVNYSLVHPIVSEAASLSLGIEGVAQTGGQPHLDSMAIEIMYFLEEKLANVSESFSDQSLECLFLLNNWNFMREKLQNNTLKAFLPDYVAALSSKVERYMERYLQVSWAPLLSCLLDPTPLCLFGKYYYPSALPKFESEFQKIHTTQKLWKVPDPELRIRLRKAIIDGIIPVYTKYIEDNNKSTTPKFTPEELEEMLQELFEGS